MTAVTLTPQQLQELIASLRPAPAASIRAREPETFDGRNRAVVNAWKTSMQNYMSLMAAWYSDERTCIRVILGFFLGEAMRWAQTLLDDITRAEAKMATDNPATHITFMWEEAIR